MNELWIHIGSHKTGTTSIQMACRDALLTHGPGAAHYFDVRQPDTRITRISGKGDNFRCDIDMETADAIFRPPARHPRSTRFVTSEEVLFWISEPDTVSEFAAMLRERFKSIKIIAYLRRQDRLALSHRKQVVLRLPAARFYGISKSPLPSYAPHFQKYFDYATKLADIWCTAFGKENVHVIPYRRDELVGGDVVPDFAYRTGVRFDPLTRMAANPSLAGNHTFLGLRLAHNAVPPATCQEILKRLPPVGSYLPARDDAREFVSHFAEANRRLAREWTWGNEPFEFDTDFESYPEKETTFSRKDIMEMLDAALPSLNRTQKG